MLEYEYEFETVPYDPTDGNEIKKLTEYLNTMSSHWGWQVLRFTTHKESGKPGRRRAEILFRRTSDRSYVERLDAERSKLWCEVEELKKKARQSEAKSA